MAGQKSKECMSLHVMDLACHPVPQRRSVSLGVEMLRCAQHDSAVTHTDGWTNLFICIIGPRWIFH